MYFKINTKEKTVGGPVSLDQATLWRQRVAKGYVIKASSTDYGKQRMELTSALRYKGVSGHPYDFDISEYQRRRLRQAFDNEDKATMVEIIDVFNIAQICSTCDREDVAMRIVEYGISNKLI